MENASDHELLLQIMALLCCLAVKDIPEETYQGGKPAIMKVGTGEPSWATNDRFSGPLPIGTRYREPTGRLYEVISETTVHQVDED